jgi:hypothetical protein
LYPASKITSSGVVMAEGSDRGKLNHMHLGRNAEYFVKMEFTRHGFDVYTAEVDDKGIDFIVRKDHRPGGTKVEVSVL